MTEPLGLFIQPACLQHKYIRHPNSSHIFERPERLRAVLLGVAAAVARLEEAEEAITKSLSNGPPSSGADDLSNMLSGLSIQSSFTSPKHLSIVEPPRAKNAGQILLHYPALQLAHSPPDSALLDGGPIPSSTYLKNLHKWASEALDTIKNTGCEIPSGLGLNQGDLYLGPGSILAIEGAVCAHLLWLG
jgi:histone deacetylase HOS3